MSDIPETRYAKSEDCHIAYQVVGKGPLDVVFIPDFVSHVEHDWDDPRPAHFYRRLASFARFILFDERGTGMSDPVPVEELPTLEQRMGRRASGHGRCGIGASGAGRCLGGRTAKSPVRRHSP
jgi:pimeloyl-ACP methyl ester carboxylesterase